MRTSHPLDITQGTDLSMTTLLSLDAAQFCLTRHSHSMKTRSDEAALGNYSKTEYLEKNRGFFLVRSRSSRSRSGSVTPGAGVGSSPGKFSKSTLAFRQKQKESVDYTYGRVIIIFIIPCHYRHPGQYQFSEKTETPPPPMISPRPEPDWERFVIRIHFLPRQDQSLQPVHVNV